MIEYLVLASAISFLLFLIPGPHQRYAGIAGWTGMVAFLFTQLPDFFAENNFVYPLMTICSVPFLVITARQIWNKREPVMHLTRGAAIAFVIYAPFEYIRPVGNWLIGHVVDEVSAILLYLQFPFTMFDWNIFINQGFRVEIILACTGIQSIAIMLGVAWAVKSTWTQKGLAFLLIAPVIYILNLLRNVFVIMAYTEQWFPYLPVIASNGEFGYESFFWAHNVICELLALGVLIVIAFALFKLIPALGVLADDLFKIYWGEIRRVRGKDTESSGQQRD
ncbi:archaeosortase A [Methanosphaerula palustris]|uniref:Cytochrome oxidase, subunit I, putative n=1 Tax=Methanosphaerula palustris (strain ATCC BAA-1556 / DSM 19958 / E1-9c) TaxID=521011 RepID=B8GDN9_METPE|nr:archaeosortase A [Methanosphaerula palustris]ACL17390.1 cytochrome oxidase, subunit I, putative [Methanosphaerula palustris E1-9c]